MVWVDRGRRAVLDDLTMGVLMSGVVLGAIGFFMFMYGKREGQPVTLIAGVALGVLPMVVHALVSLWIVSGVVIGGVMLHRRNSETSVVA